MDRRVSQEDMLDEIAILRDIRIAEDQIARGEVTPHDEVGDCSTAATGLAHGLHDSAILVLSHFLL